MYDNFLFLPELQIKYEFIVKPFFTHEDHLSHFVSFAITSGIGNFDQK